MRELRNSLIVLLLGVLAVFVQGTIFYAFAPGLPASPNLLIPLVAFLVLQDGGVRGLVLSFLLGIEFDLSSGLLLGPWAGAFVVIYAVLSALSQRIFVESALSIMAVVFASAVLSSFIYLALVFQFKPADTVPLSFSVRLLLEALLSALFAPLLFKLFSRMIPSPKDPSLKRGLALRSRVR